MLPELLECAQASATTSELEAQVLALLDRHVGCDVAYFSSRGQEAFPTVLRLDRPVVETAIARGPLYLREFMPVKRAALAARGVAVDTDVLGLERVRGTSYFRELVARVGARHSLMAYVRFRGHVIAAVMLGRGGTGFSSEEVRRVETVLPALGVVRAACGLPVLEELGTPCEPLCQSTAPGFLERLGFGSRARVLASVPWEGGALTVRDRAGFREMVASDGAGRDLVWSRAALHDAGESGWPYIELFHVAAAWAKRRERALFVGSGGAVAVRQFARVYPGIALDLVEHEAGVIELARRYFDLGSIPSLRVHLADGAAFFRDAPAEQWDIAIVDAYDASGLGLSPTLAFFRSVRRALRPGGTVAFNLIGSLAGPELASVVRAAGDSFHEVRLLPVATTDETFSPHAPRNIVVVARRDG